MLGIIARSGERYEACQEYQLNLSKLQKKSRQQLLEQLLL